MYQSHLGDFFKLLMPCICAGMLSCVQLVLWPHGLQSARLLCPWDFPGKNTGVGCISYPRGYSRPRVRTRVSWVFCIGTGILYHSATWEDQCLNPSLRSPGLLCAGDNPGLRESLKLCSRLQSAAKSENHCCRDLGSPPGPCYLKISLYVCSPWHRWNGLESLKHPFQCLNPSRPRLAKTPKSLMAFQSWLYYIIAQVIRNRPPGTGRHDNDSARHWTASTSRKSITQAILGC